MFHVQGMVTTIVITMFAGTILMCFLMCCICYKRCSTKPDYEVMDAKTKTTGILTDKQIHRIMSDLAIPQYKQ